MAILVLVVLAIVLAVGLGIAIVLRKQARTTTADVVPVEPAEDETTREARHRAVDQQGSELLERRVDLDGRRGTLTGDAGVYAAFDDLERRFRAGTISEDEFETEKVRILGG